MKLEEKIYRENLKLASFQRRFCAFFVDKSLISFVFSLIHWENLSQISQSYEAIHQYIFSVLWQVIGLSFFYEFLFVMLYGATFGKMLFKIRILSISLLDSPKFFSSCIRASLKIFGEIFFYCSYFLFFFTPFKQTLHDLLAKTLVVKND